MLRSFTLAAAITATLAADASAQRAVFDLVVAGRSKWDRLAVPDDACVRWRDRALSLKRPFPNDGGHSFKALIPEAAAYADGFGRDRSDARLCENGKLIGRPHTAHAVIAAAGGGNFSHWGERLWFSTSDNSDPNKNKRSYKIVFSPIPEGVRAAFRTLGLNYIDTQVRALLQHPTDNDRILAAARLVAERFDRRRTMELIPPRNPSVRVMHILASPRIPPDTRIPVGAADFLTADEVCDSSARALRFLLKKMGYESEQIDISLARNGGHSAVSVRKPDGTDLFVDPYLGVAGNPESGVQSIEQIAEILQAGQDPRELLVPLKRNANYNYYGGWSLAPVFFARSGHNINIDVLLPPTNGRTIQLGKLNRSPQDVMEDSLRANLTSLFGHVGGKYDPTWSRTLRASEGVRIEMTLIDKPKRDALHTNLAFSIKGRTVRWVVPAGSHLIFAAGAASYQDVDRIRIIPLRSGRSRMVRFGHSAS